MNLVEASGILGLKVRTMYRWCRLGWIEASKVDGVWDIPVESMTEEVKRRAIEAGKYSCLSKAKK